MERIDGLEQEHRDIMAGFRTHYADRKPKELEAEQSRFFAKLRAGGPRNTDSMPLEVMLTFPGFVNHKKPPS